MQKTQSLALASLFAGACAIGTSAVLVKLCDVGPVSSAFWRVALAIPVLALWARMADGGAAGGDPRTNRTLLFLCGLFFAGDLAFWHWSIVLTSVANATLLANCAPIFVTLAAWLFFRRTPRRRARRARGGGSFASGVRPYSSVLRRTGPQAFK